MDKQNDSSERAAHGSVHGDGGRLGRKRSSVEASSTATPSSGGTQGWIQDDVTRRGIFRRRTVRRNRSRHPSRGKFLRLLSTACFALALAATLFAQQPAHPPREDTQPAAPARTDLSQAAEKVVVNPLAHDEEIGERLQQVLEATGWFTDPHVEVDEGVVFLSGQVESDELKIWAGDLARNTQDVVAVVNRMEIPVPSMWDFTQAQGSLSELWRNFQRKLPILVFGLLILAVSVAAAMGAKRATHALIRKRVRAKLLQNVIALCVAGLVFLCGVYLVLRAAGLAQLALTLVGGTGLLGLIVGIAFRDITENFLSSIFLSMQRPFETGDLVEIAGVTGYVQQLNVRTTILMTLDGNLTQIPNATVYKSNISNFTTNSNRRDSFTVGIGYDDPISVAQETARKVMDEHPAVLKDPEPAVLVEALGSATVTLRVYFWFNGREHSLLKVRSSVIRLVKRAYQQAAISMPDEAREVVFPNGVPVTMVEAKQADARPASATKRAPPAVPPGEHGEVSTKAEGGLHSEAADIDKQAQESDLLKEGENLLGDDPGEKPAAAGPKAAK